MNSIAKICLGLALLASSPAWAQSLTVTVTATVDGNNVVACMKPVKSTGEGINACAEQWNLFREDQATGKAWRLTDCTFNSADGSSCFTDYCLAPGKYTYGHDCGDTLASAEITQSVDGCRAPTGVPLPTPSNAEAPFRTCSTGGCASAPGMPMSGLAGIVLLGIALARRRR